MNENLCKFIVAIIAVTCFWGCANRNEPLDESEIAERIKTAFIMQGNDQWKLDEVKVLKVFGKNMDPEEIKCAGANIGDLVELAQRMDYVTFALCSVNGTVRNTLTIGSRGGETIQLNNKKVWFSLWYTDKDGRDRWSINPICDE